MLNKKIGVLLGLILISGVLTGCMGEPFAEAYFAYGSGPIRDLDVTETFDTIEDLQLVIRFNQHSESIRIETFWFDPEGAEAGELQTTVPADTENVLITYHLEQAEKTYWLPGEWSVEVRLDGQLEETLSFIVTGEIPQDAIGDDATEETESEDSDGYDIDAPTNPFG